MKNWLRRLRDALSRCRVSSPNEATVGAISPPGAEKDPICLKVIEALEAHEALAAAHASPVDAVPQLRRQIRRQNIDPEHEPGNRRIVRTARTVDEINDAARQGLRPLVKAVLPGKDIHHMVAVFQDPETGEIELSGDVRGWGFGEKVIDYTLYYPYHFPNPFAAYLLPRDLAVGEEVWLEDLIEDVVAVWGNQGYHPRLEAGPAIWNGMDFEVIHQADEWIG